MKFSYLLAHLFLPHHTNNFKAALLQPPALLIITAVILLFSTFQIPLRFSNVLGYTAASLPVDRIVELTNQKRAQNGLSSLKFNSTLATAASAKGSHMLTRDYWAHIAPDGTTPWVFFNQVGYRYLYAGENLARDFDSPEGVVDAWMASPTHRDNILSGKYDDIGIAVVQGDLGGQPTTLVVQLLGKSIGGAGNVPVAGTTNNQIPTSKPSPSSQPEASPTAPIAQAGEVSPTPKAAIIRSQPTVIQAARSPFSLEQSMGVGVLGMLLVVLAADAVVVFRRRLVRVSGRTLAHFSFFAGVAIMVLVLQKGNIL
ncbi:hypothetical protein HY405_00435 [Candidatus Microgenomates bacterium]|nr:hypothetical protein [Candidatus Microgenomates bacterium]